MKIGEQTITFNKQELTLNTQRSIYWKDQKTLILSDLHLGKAAHFRKHGIAIPMDTAITDLTRLESLIAYYQAKQVIVVGDLIHAGINQEVLLLESFRQRHPELHLHLVKGNHDRLSQQMGIRFGIVHHKEAFEMQQIQFKHHPADAADSSSFRISGHIHPGISLVIPPKRKVRLPCFLVSTHQIILPAFSTFTGLDSKDLSSLYQSYAISDDHIFPITRN
ncbi:MULTISPECIES: ligase-associated DNA damage response endonuclease PdeM [Sphingobacterium]|uniref:ligase-associated DNA damage response endonuclease PdeM n=1 Tax=Sphingobacterium TaxID=28453 RepID=UPI000E84A822|nr:MULTISPECIES: ligase-associated DNA damage response endonuclease PdeM [Sphingobacterium]HAU54593.1 phosphoesterase [Sphingobacterium sp.]HCX56568.1 ligase-associated DNA damage response endonuclease PdeM [Sphingobacterium sp.]